MKIFTSAQIGELDHYTIEQESIASIDLMERAANALFQEIVARWNKDVPFTVFAGKGNNGGDAMVLARLLVEKGYQVCVYLFNPKGQLSEDCEESRKRLMEAYPDVLHEIQKEFEPPRLTAEDVVIDGLFGVGLNKPLSGGFASLVKYINATEATVVSIDLPSGLIPEDNSANVGGRIIKADLTLTFGMKKLCMMFADCNQYIGELKVLDIGLSKEGADSMQTPYNTLEEKDVKAMLLKRGDFAHKGSMGHALLVAGSEGVAGAAILATKACLRSGVGKVTLHTPKCNNTIIQVSVPEAVLHLDKEAAYISEASDSSVYQAIGMGPGIGQAEGTAIAMMTMLRGAQAPCVLDADALNILASHRAWMQQLPEGVIFTPHPKEMDGLCDVVPADDYERMQSALHLAKRLKVYIIVKGHYSALCMPDGQVWFNSTGNSGMATAGSGDVLTGVITALLARGYSSKNAAALGMYLHGLAGDIAAEKYGVESLVASDIVACLPEAFKKLGK